MTANHSHIAALNIADPECQLWGQVSVHLTCERASCTISIKTFRVSL